VSLGVIAVAFGIAPCACERGLDVYVESGVAAAVLTAGIPFIVGTGDSIRAGSVSLWHSFVSSSPPGWQVSSRPMCGYGVACSKRIGTVRRRIAGMDQVPAAT